MPAAQAGPGLLAVEAVNFPKLRTGGELVELKLTVPAARVVMLTPLSAAQLSTTLDSRRR